MKKSYMVAGSIVSAGFIIAGCGGGDNGNSGDDNTDVQASGEEHDLQMSVTVGESSTWYEAAEMMADEVREETDGRIDISVYANEQLSSGDSGGAVEGLMQGTIDLTYNSTIIYSIMDERFGVLSAPFLFENLDQVDEALAGEGGEEINEILRENGVEPLGFAQNGFRQVTNSSHPIQSPEDLNGMQIRVPGINMYTDLWRELGADPTTMDFSEVFTSLQQNTIDGQENPIDVIHSSQLQEVQDYLTLWNYSYDPLVLGMNQDLYDSLSEEDQEIMRNAAENANAHQVEEARNLEEEQINELEEAGMEIYEPTEEELEEFREAVSSVYDEYREVWGEELLDTFEQ